MKLPWLKPQPVEPPATVEIRVEDLHEMLSDMRDMQVAMNERLVRVETRLCALMKYHNVPTHIEPRVIAHRVREDLS